MKDKKKIIMICISVLVLVLVCIGIYKAFSKGEGEKREDVVINDVKIYKNLEGTIEEYDKTMYVEGYQGNYEKAYYISGELRPDKDYANLLILFDVKDKKDNVIGTAIAGLTDVKKGGDYNFKALSTVKESDLDKIHTFEVSDIRGE